MDFIPRVTPKWDRPVWLEPFVSLVERATNEPVRATAAAPPQHGKTEVCVHGLIRALLAQPNRRHGYATYNAKRAASVERKARIIAQRAGLKLRFRQDMWLNEVTGGSLVWASRRGGLTGEPIDGLLIIDDIIKDRREAESGLVLEECADWFDDVAEPRCHASASIIEMMTRWSPRDLTGLLTGRGWPYLNLQAIADGEVDENGVVIDDPLGRKLGEPLCEARKSLANLKEKKRVNAFSFASLYQGAPRPRGGTVFGEATYYTELPKTYRAGYGVDLAYTSQTRSDFSVCIKGFMAADGFKADGKPRLRLYIVDVQRKQVDAPAFTLTIRSMWSGARGPLRWYCATSELGSGQFVKAKVPSFQSVIASADKYIRATGGVSGNNDGGAAAAWNDGCILLPGKPEHIDEEDWIEPEWVDDLLAEVQSFTGVKDAHDDQVDALAALWDVLSVAGAPMAVPPGGGGGAGGGSRWDGIGGRGF